MTVRPRGSATLMGRPLSTGESNVGITRRSSGQALATRAGLEQHGAPFAHDESALPGLLCGHTQGAQKNVVVIRVVVKDAQPLGSCRLAQPNPLLPGGVTPADLRRKLVVRVGAVVEHQVGALDQGEDVLIERTGAVLRVGHVAKRDTAMLDAVTGG